MINSSPNPILTARELQRHEDCYAEGREMLRGTVPEARVTVIIPNWNGEKWLSSCLRGLYSQEFKDFETILVDNGSTDQSISFVKENYPKIKIIAFQKNQGFAVAANTGIRASRADYIVLLNNDTCPQPNWLLSLVTVMDQSPAETGSLASKMLNFSNPNFIENAGDIFSWYGSATKRGHGQPAEEFTLLDEILSPCAGAAIYRRSFLEELGGFDEYFFAYLEDVDLGLRGRLSGYKCLFVPSAKVLHQGHGSSMTRTRYIQLITRNRLLIFIKNAPWPLLLKHFIKLLYGQWYFFIVYRKPLSSIVGYLSCIPMIPHALKERRNIKNKSKLSVKEIDNLLEKKFNMPSLSEMILNRIKAFWK